VLSYAQNGEDVVLNRLFTGQPAGQYVDIGANHPVVDSVTKHFSLRGWRGVNVEPLPAFHALLCEDRPLDTNLQAAVSDQPGPTTLFAFDDRHHGLSTLSPATARAVAVPATELVVDTLTLAEVLGEHTRGPVDFLKIDVEGFEAEVIRSGDWAASRPRVVVVEATAPRTTTPTHEAWEPVLLAAGYRCTLFDGLNRFYAQADDDQALACLSVAANVTDDYVPYPHASRVAALDAEVHRLRHELRRLRAEES
jgi:FkbM family methyltransferase